MPEEMGQFGPNSGEVESLLDRLRVLPAAEWAGLVSAYQSLPTDRFEDLLAGALDASGLREQWFALRAEATGVAREAARAYAEEVGEAPRTLEHVKSVNAWDGQREVAYQESLPPSQERAFIDAACGACGVLFMRPFVAESEFAALWEPFASVV
jgi:hypothetical protein